MKRKLVKQGTSTLMISLPRKWVKQNNLQKGSEVDLVAKDHDLTILAQNVSAAVKEIILIIDQNNAHGIKNLLTHAYRRGYDRIILKNVPKNQHETIRQTVTDLLLGFEIVDHTQDMYIIDNISEPSNEKYETILRRIFLIIKESHLLFVEDLAKGTFLRLAEMHQNRINQDKHVLFCRRIIAKENSHRLLEWELLTFLMHIQHKYYYLYYSVQKKSVRKDPKILAVCERIQEYFNLFYRSYFEKSTELIHTLNKSRDEFYLKTCFGLLEKSSGTNTLIIAQLAEIIRLIQIGSSPLLALFIEEGMGETES